MCNGNSGECGTRPVTLSEISFLLTEIMSAWCKERTRKPKGLEREINLLMGE
jgi:hypothetical protein